SPANHAAGGRVAQQDQPDGIAALAELDLVHQLPDEEEPSSAWPLAILGKGGIGYRLRIEPGPRIPHAHLHTGAIDTYLHPHVLGGVLATTVEDGVGEGLRDPHAKVEAEA